MSWWTYCETSSMTMNKVASLARNRSMSAIALPASSADAEYENVPARLVSHAIGSW